MSVTVNKNYSAYSYMDKDNSNMQGKTDSKAGLIGNPDYLHGFDRVLMGKVHREKTSVRGRDFTEELYRYVDEIVESNQANKPSTIELRKQTCVEGSYASYKFAGETIEYGFCDFIEESADEPLWHWHDGQFGYTAEVFKNEGTESEYTVKLLYDNGKEEKRIVDADSINTSNCNIVDLSVKMYHLEAEGKIDNPVPQILIAHLYMKYRTPEANENTNINFKNWFERQLELEMKDGKNKKHVEALMDLLRFL